MSRCQRSSAHTSLRSNKSIPTFMSFFQTNDPIYETHITEFLWLLRGLWLWTRFNLGTLRAGGGKHLQRVEKWGQWEFLRQIVKEIKIEGKPLKAYNTEQERNRNAMSQELLSFTWNRISKKPIELYTRACGSTARRAEIQKTLLTS